MNLLEIRQKFILLSGREELATETTVPFDTDAAGDNTLGADFFIQSACRKLDKKIDNPQTLAYHTMSLAVDAVDVIMKDCRAVEKVYYLDSDSERVPLDYLKVDEAIDEYPKLDDTDSGDPTHYVIYPLRTIAKFPVPSIYSDLLGVKILPPTDTATSIIVFGKFSSLMLVNNEDENYWSIEQPEVLIQASLQVLEGFYRNTQGYKDYGMPVAESLDGIDKDMVEQDFSDIPLQIKG